MDSRAPGSVSSPVRQSPAAKSHPHEGRNFWVLTAYGSPAWRCSRSRVLLQRLRFALATRFPQRRRSTTAQAWLSVSIRTTRAASHAPARPRFSRRATMARVSSLFRVVIRSAAPHIFS